MLPCMFALIQPDMLHVAAGAASSTVSSLDSGFVSHDASSLHTAYHDPGLLQLNNAKVSCLKTGMGRLCGEQYGIPECTLREKITYA